MKNRTNYYRSPQGNPPKNNPYRSREYITEDHYPHEREIPFSIERGADWGYPQRDESRMNSGYNFRSEAAPGPRNERAYRELHDSAPDSGHSAERGERYASGFPGMNDYISRRSIGHVGKGPKNYRRSDTRIHEEVCDALTHDPEVDATEIEVSVQAGVVTLTGTVIERGMKRSAEDCAERIAGVVDVRNQITLQAPGTSPDLSRH